MPPPVKTPPPKHSDTPRFRRSRLARAALNGVLLGVLLAGPVSGGAAAAPVPPLPPVNGKDLEAISHTFVQIAERITPAVVGVSITRVVSEGNGSLFSDPYFRWFFGNRGPQPREREEEGLGSGVLVSADGLIVTNEHVVGDADHIKVTLSDRRAFDATVVGVDRKTDLAVLKIDGKDLPWVPFGDSTQLRPGEVVLAVGNPFGLTQTVTMGIVSGVGRQGVGISDYEDFIQTDAAINPGNSGGAMVNTRGELIGINTAIFTQSGGYEGIGFAIPAELARTITQSLVEHGRVVRGWLGVSIQEVTPELARQFGVKTPRGALVTEVLGNSPAEAAGIRRGDVIMEVNGEEITNLARLRILVASTKVGSQVKLRLVRGGRTRSVQVTIGELPEDVASAGPRPETTPGDFDNVLSGLSVGPLSRDNALRFQLDPGGRGVVVLDVYPGSPASRAGLMPGDVIIEVDRQEVSDLAAYNRIARRIEPDAGALLLIARRGQTLYVGIEP
jgi:serine protease Do